MTTLVIAQHDNSQLHASTLNTVSAATQVGNEVTVLVAGSGAGDVAAQAAQINGVAKVLHTEGEHFSAAISVELADLIVSIASDYQCILSLIHI